MPTRRHRTIRPLVLATTAAAALFLGACGSAETPEAATGGAGGASTSSADTGTGVEVPAGGGAYVTRAEYEADPTAYEGSKVVYFFHASWCPTCRATERAIGETGIPEGLTVVKADYDSDTELREKYGVTTQHTFVQVGPDGAELAKWTGSADGAAILEKTV